MAPEIGREVFSDGIRPREDRGPNGERTEQLGGGYVAMTDEKDTKRFMDRNLERLEKKLLDGSATEAEMQQAVGEIVGHLRILVARNTVTEEDCMKRMIECPGAKLFKNPAKTVKEEVMKQGFGMLGWVLLVGFLAWKAYLA